MIPTIPNSNMPVVREDGIITSAWQRALALLFSNSVQEGMLVVWVGASPPKGWVQDSTVGLPALPGGMMWIRKS
jgi:hypothetical protein